MNAAAAGAAGRELEIKLTGTTAAITRALRSPPVQTLQDGRPRTRTLESTYFDTADARLREQGAGLRLRRQGRRWVQTLKRERAVLGGLHDRDEVEHLVTAQWPDYALYDHTDFEALFASAPVRQRIQPLFSTRFLRTTRLLRDGQSQIELAYDRGMIVHGERQEPLCELELELKAGQADALFTLADALCTGFGLRLDVRSKAERGYALALGEAAAPCKARDTDLTASMTVSDGFVAVSAECVQHLQRNEFGLITGENPEYVHQARVALRRLRAAFALFRPAVKCAALDALEDELRRLAQALGTARDWDVFCLETLPRLPAELDAQGGLAQLTSQAQTLRSQADQFARDIVAHAQFTRVLLSMGRILYTRPWERVPVAPAAATPPTTITDFARDALTLAWRRVLRRAKHLDAGDPRTHHALRIALKRMRYGGEYFAALFPGKSTRQFLAAMAVLQERLGRVNDALTLQRLTAILREDCHEAAAREALGLLRGYFAGRMTAALKRIDKEWKDLKRAPPFWNSPV